MPSPLRRKLAETEIAAAVLTVKSLSDAVNAARLKGGPGALVVAWISDIHIAAPVDHSDAVLYGYAKKVDSSAQTTLAFAEIATLNPAPEALIIGGDICDRGELPDIHRHEIAEATQVVGTLPPALRILPIQGNHDHAPTPLASGELDALRSIGASWPPSVVDTDYYYTSLVGGWRVIALDSRAGIGEAQRGWLEQVLNHDVATPTVVISHGPWLKCGNWVDEYCLGDDITFEMIERAPNVKLVLSGHTHKRRAWNTGWTMHAILPACCYGIDDATGWGAIVLTADSVSAMFVKELKTRSWESNGQAYAEQAGNWSELAIETWTP